MRPEDPWQKLPLFFMFTMLIHACCANSDTIFQVRKSRINSLISSLESFIYYYALCSETFDWDPVKANQINMIFWTAFIVGRFSGTYAARKLKPTFLILIYFTGSTVGIRKGTKIE